MGLPRIAPYALPSRDELPRARVTWRLERRRAALLIHDMQRYFVGAFQPDADPIAPAIRNIARVLTACRAHAIPVFFTAQRGDQLPKDRGLQADFWGPGLTASPDHEAIVEEIAPTTGEVVLTKHRYSAFQRSDFAQRLGSLRRDQLIVTGVYAHIGCLVTAADAFMQDIEPFFVADAVADFSRADHDLALTHVAGCCGRVVTHDETVQAIEQELHDI